jgi:hypothetical protein
MTVSSYLFQSPYSQPVQMGRPDPLAQVQKTDTATQNLAKETKVAVPAQSEVKPTLETGVSINLAALSGSDGQKAANVFNAANTKVQAQSAYQNS